MSTATLPPSITTSGFGYSRSGQLPKLAKALRPEESVAEKELRKTGEKLVGQVFLAPMLRQMRESPFKDEIFSGGRGGAAFASMLDQEIVSRASGSSMSSGIVDNIVNRFRAQANSAETRKKADEMRKQATEATKVLPPQPAKGTDSHVSYLG